MTGVQDCSTLVRNERALVRQLDDSVLLMAPDGGGVVSLTGSGPELWRSLRQPMTEEQLVAVLADRFRVTASQIAADVHAVVVALRAARLVEGTAP